MNETLATLYYIHDPMCSWCWGFRPVWNQLQAALRGRVNIQYVLAGLAVDTQQAMPEAMQINIRDTWRTIQKEIPGTEFNYDFWTDCQPRRSTYPACRAIIACRMQQAELEQDMLLMIQQAYYLQAKNPSDIDTLLALAGQLGLDTDDFAKNMQSEACHKLLSEEIQFCRDINIHSFPGLVLMQGKSYTLLDIDYNNKKNILNQVF